MHLQDPVTGEYKYIKELYGSGLPGDISGHTLYNANNQQIKAWWLMGGDENDALDGTGQYVVGSNSIMDQISPGVNSLNFPTGDHTKGAIINSPCFPCEINPGNIFGPAICSESGKPIAKHQDGNRVRSGLANTRPNEYTLPDRGRNEHVFVERFSAPGGPEINSRGYLDLYAEERSVHNAMPWRNLSVRGYSSGERAYTGSLRMNTHKHFAGSDYSSIDWLTASHENTHIDVRNGVKMLLTNHSGRFGTFISSSAARSNLDTNEQFITNNSLYPSTRSNIHYHKINRNTLNRLEICGVEKSSISNKYAALFNSSEGTPGDSTFNVGSFYRSSAGADINNFFTAAS